MPHAEPIIAPSPTPTVQIRSLRDVPVSSLSALKTNHPGLVPAILVLANHSDQAIVAVSALWTITLADGTQHRTRHQCDVFLPAGLGKVLAPPNSMLFLGPGTCVSDQSQSTDLSRNVSLGEQRTPALIHGAATLHITVEAIMFDNGQMFATNPAYASEIKQRVAAANAVAHQLRAGLARGLTKQQAVASLAAAANTSLGAQGEWYRTFAQSLATTLAHSPETAFDAHLHSLERLNLASIKLHQPEPPRPPFDLRPPPRLS